MAGSTLEARFWSHVDKTGDCWLWTGSVNQAGYGQIFLFRTPDGKRVLEGAHRVAVKLTGRDIPPQLEPDHTCRVKTCVNPAHLELVPHQINTLRRNNGLCKRGHPLEGNSVQNGKGVRTCRTCKREHDRKWRRRIKWPEEL